MDWPGRFGPVDSFLSPPKKLLQNLRCVKNRVCSDRQRLDSTLTVHSHRRWCWLLYALLIFAPSLPGCSDSRTSFQTDDQSSVQPEQYTATSESDRTSLNDTTDKAYWVSTNATPDRDSADRYVADLDSGTPIRSGNRLAIPDTGRFPPVLALHTNRGSLFGLPIGLFSDQTLLMSNDGMIHILPNADIANQEILNQPFRPLEASDLITSLHSEFGRSYKARIEHPYVVVSSQESLSVWSKRFRVINQAVRNYCTTHGIPTRPIEYPLTAVVFSSRQEFLQYSRDEQADVPPNCAGYYSQKSNRIVLFESPDRRTDAETLATISHEATHQLAFNTGLHQRLAATPLWTIEGFATMFEAPAFSESNGLKNASSWPMGQRGQWQEIRQSPAKLQRLIEELIRSDKPFKSDIHDAYCVSWAMTLYLSQRHSHAYANYLRNIASLQPFAEYPAGDRTREFREHFGSDLGILARSIIRHIDTLP